jgi:hypothetical protein
MEERSQSAWLEHWAVLPGILLLALVVRVYHIDRPLVEHWHVKQVFVANKARNIAGPPFNPLCNTFDFLDESGQRLRLTEEIPTYMTIVGAAYRLFGEHEWLGRLWSILATLVGLAAFRGLVEREFSRRIALVATLILAMAPESIFIGRAVQPDASMLACMLLSAYCFRRYLDEARRGWWTAAVLSGLAAAAFKYYGLMVLLPLADMAWRQRGWRGWFRWDFVLLGLGMTLPIFLWMAGVFERTPNPWRRGESGHYFIWEEPKLLTQTVLWERLVGRFLYKDFGPVAAFLLLGGVWAVLRRGQRARPALGWTLMALGFYFLLGAKLERHDYYELMMLPAAALWAALGWEAFWTGKLWPSWPARRRAWVGLATLVVLIVVHSPLVSNGRLRPETAHLILAERVQHFCSPTGRIVILGPDYEYPIVHYGHREGLVLCRETLDADWYARLADYQAWGAECVVVYFNPLTTDKQREAYMTLTERLPILEHRSGKWSRRGRVGEYYILALPNKLLASGEHQPSRFLPFVRAAAALSGSEVVRW